MRRFQTRRTPIAIALGVATALLLGSVLAVVVDTVAFDDNVGVTGAIDDPEGDLQVALVFEDEDCGFEFLTYEDGPFDATYSTNFNLNPGLNTVLDVPGAFRPGVEPGDPRSGGEAIGDESLAFCVRNAGDTPITVDFDSTIVSVTEVGACTPSESAAGDTTCAAGDPGEVTGFSFFREFNFDSGCFDTESLWPAGESERLFDQETEIAAGQACKVDIGTHIDIADDDGYRQAQTDRIEFDFIISADVS